MEGYEYVDIFATKGIEYIVAIIFLLMLIWFWRWINRPSPAAATTSQNVQDRVSLVDWFRLANDLYYHQGHSWVNPADDGSARIGIDDFAQKLVGKPTEIKLPAVGSVLQQGEKGLQIKIGDKSIDFLSPVDGQVIAVNDKVLHTPELINQDPYEQGWLLKVRSSKLKTNLKNLLQGKVAKAWIEETVNKLSSRISGNYGIVLQDGGTITSGFIKELAPENWEQVAAEFFMTGD
jgi:glycine cleavage system H lipoate-binding protein